MTTMSNPGDLEGEVDHSFFDSDYDGDTDGAHKVENDGLKAEEGSPPAHESTDGTENPLMPVINDNNREVDHTDENSQSPNESEEEDDASSQSLASIGSSIDADSESSFSNNSGRISSDSPPLPRHNEQPSYSGVSRTQVGSTGFADMPIGHTEESEDTVTDVTPLSSPNISPLHSSDLEGCFEEQQQQEEEEHGEEEEEEEEEEESVPSSGRSDMHHDEYSYQDADQCSFGSESQLGGEVIICCPGAKNRKNYSFSNEEVRLIDIENKRLLQALSELSTKRKRESAAEKYSSKPPLNFHTHNSVNRRREQARIERQNLAIQKRLESVKPTAGLQRSKQLADYQRLTRNSGPPTYTFRVSTTRRVRSTSRASSGTEGSWV